MREEKVVPCDRLAHRALLEILDARPAVARYANDGGLAGWFAERSKPIHPDSCWSLTSEGGHFPMFIPGSAKGPIGVRWEPKRKECSEPLFLWDPEDSLDDALIVYQSLRNKIGCWISISQHDNTTWRAIVSGGLRLDRGRGKPGHAVIRGGSTAGEAVLRACLAANEIAAANRRGRRRRKR